VADQLGDLAVSGEREHRLRSTVRNYLEGGANVRAVARDLNYHRNTIQQRLDLAARLRGRPLDDDRCGLALALQVAEHYGDAVLRQV
jgi:DNA-binding PucR family transcriptional regulator